MGPWGAGACGLPLPEDHHRVEDASRPPPLISLSTLPPPPAPSCFDGRKKFQLFPSLFFQTGDSLGKGIPPSPNHHSTYISMPWFQAHPVVLRVVVIFGCFMGVVPQGRAYGGYSAAFSQSTSPLPGSSPPPSHPLCLSSGRREGSLLSRGINNSGGYSALKT